MVARHAHTVCLCIVCSGLLLQITALANTWRIAFDTVHSEGWSYKIAWPATGLVLIYMLEVGFLHWAYAAQDSTALDWAVVVLLMGGLVIHPLAATSAIILAILVRASLVFSYSADPSTKEFFESHGR